jgi:hypothetical protein
MVWKCVRRGPCGSRRGPGGSSEPPEPPICYALRHAHPLLLAEAENVLPLGHKVPACARMQNLNKKVKFTGLTQNSQVDPAVRLRIIISALKWTQILGQPCEFQVKAPRWPRRSSCTAGMVGDGLERMVRGNELRSNIPEPSPWTSAAQRSTRYLFNRCHKIVRA